MSLQERNRLIAGGSNLYSKKPELYCQGWPEAYESARGITITTPNGQKFRDFSGAGVGACVLGYSDPDVDAAVTKAITKGSTSALLCSEEVELAKVLIQLHPWAQQVRFCRSGGEAIAIAIRIAQAYTKRKSIDYSTDSYHGWHVNNPLTGACFMQADGVTADTAAAILEPSRLTEDIDRLKIVKDWTRKEGAVLIFDEISCGFRQNLGGRHLHYGVNPDVAVFSKAMSNGYPMAAVIGTAKVMSAVQDTFISSTTWSERIGPTAALATIQKLWAEDVFTHTAWVGDLVKTTLIHEAKRAGLDLQIEGPGQILHLRFGDIKQQTLYTQLMLERGFLASKDFYASYAHTLEDCGDFADAVKEVFPLLHNTKLLRGPVAESGIKR